MDYTHLVQVLDASTIASFEQWLYPDLWLDLSKGLS